MTQITENDKKYLIKLARMVIQDRLGEKQPDPEPKEISPALQEKRGCFVTLHQNNQLRGCIGTIEPIMPLIVCVKENAVLAAFQDPRFLPVSINDLAHITIEISILTQPRQVSFQNADELVSILKPGVHGVILSQGYMRATFLPQVWEQLPKTEDFLAHLCLKAGMGKMCWKDPKITVEVYEVAYFSEKD